MARVARLGLVIDSSGAKKGSQETNTALNSIDQTAKRAVESLKKAGAALGVAFAVRGLQQAVDTYGQLEGRLRLVTTGTQNLARVQSELLRVAQGTRQTYESTVDLYTRIARSAGELGLSQEDLIRVTENIGQALVVSGTSAASASGALTQLAQAFGAGTVRAEEFNSIMDGAPRLAQAVAQSLGVTIGQLRQMVVQGQLSSKALADAIRNNTQIGEEFSKIAPTLGGAMTQLNNAFGVVLGGSREAQSASAALASGIGEAARFMVEYQDAVKAVALALGVSGLVVALSAATAGFTTITGVATAAWAAITGPIGLAVAGFALVTTGIYLLIKAFKDKRAAAEAAAGGMQVAKKSADELYLAAKNLAAVNWVPPEMLKQLQNLGGELKALQTGGVQNAAAFKMAAEQWKDSGDKTRTYAEALADGDAKAKSYFTTASAIVAMQGQLTTTTERQTKAQRDAEKTSKDLAEALDKTAFSAGMARQRAIENANALRQFVEPVKMSFAEVLKLVQAQEKAANVATAHANAVRLGIADTVSYRAEVMTATQVEELRSKGITITTALLERLAAANMKLVQAQDAANGTNANIKAMKEWDSALQSVSGTLRDISQALNGTGNDAVKMIGLLATALDQLARAQQRADQMRNSGQKMSGTQRAATAVGGAVGSFGAGFAVGSSTSSRTTGALGGAAAGAATGAAAGTVIPGVGNLIGAVVGGLIGGIGGLLGASKNATQQLIAQRAAQQQLNEALNTMRASFAGDGLSQALSQASAQFVQLRQQAEAAFSGRKNEAERNRVLAELNALETQRLAIIRQQFEESMRLAMGDLSVRQMRAAGADTEADRLAESLAAQKEMNEATEKFGKDSPYVAQLRKVQEAEAAAAEATRTRLEAEKAAQQARDRTAFGLDMTQRRQTLNGDSRGAFITGQTISSNSALAQAQQLVEAGTITAAMFEELKTLLGDEMVAALRDFDEAARQAKQAVQDDLAVRALVATGQSAAAEQKRIEIANARELQGVTDEGLRAQILYVQGLEAVARATAAAAEAERIRQEQNASIDQRMIEALRILDPERAKELEAKQLEVDRAREIAEAADAATAARLRELFAMQDAAKALAMVTEEMERQKKAAEELADFTRSIGSQYLRSQGKNFDADLADLNDWRTEQLKRAASVGAGADVISQINAIYDARYGALIAAQMKADTPAPVTTPASFGGSTAADSSITLGEDTVAVRSARSITEATALQLVDYAASQTALLRRLVQLAEGGSGPTGSALASPSLDLVDRQLGARANTASLLLAGSVR